MEKTKLIKLRDTLKTVENFPLRIFINNGHSIADESLVTQFTKWDDTNGLLYVFRLIGMQEDNIPNNLHQSISVFVADYEEIQAMEIVRLPLSKIGGCIDGITASGCKISNDFKKRIIDTFEQLLDPNRYRLSPADINRAVSSNELQETVPNAVNEKDDYYTGKLVESYQETVGVNRYNNSSSKN